MRKALEFTIRKQKTMDSAEIKIEKYVRTMNQVIEIVIKIRFSDKD